jgi:hypothetical protein
MISDRHSTYDFVPMFQVKTNGVCSNMDLSDHAHILHTGIFEGEEFNEKKSHLSETYGSRDI